MLEPASLIEALAAIAPQPFAGVLFRVVDYEVLLGRRSAPPHAVRPLYGLGAAKHGARFTPPERLAGQAVESLYMAEDAATAFAEAARVPDLAVQRQPRVVEPQSPKVIFSAQANLERVLDLTSGDVQGRLRTSETELHAPWRPANLDGRASTTQLLGEAVYESRRFQAIRYGSSVSAGRACLVIFAARLTQPSFVEIFDPFGNLEGRLPAS